MADPFIGQVMAIPYTFVPAGWLLCDGSRMLVYQFQSLFSLIAYTFGGNPGDQLFTLPNLNGAMIVGAGTRPEFTSRKIGQEGGVGQVALTYDQMSLHTHQAFANASANQLIPTNFVWAGDSSGVNATFAPLPSNVNLSSTDTLSFVGGDKDGVATPHANIPPVLALRYVIAAEGVYPVSE